MKKILLILMILNISLMANNTIKRDLKVEQREIENYSKYNMIDRNLKIEQRNIENYSKNKIAINRG